MVALEGKVQGLTRMGERAIIKDQRGGGKGLKEQEEIDHQREIHVARM